MYPVQKRVLGKLDIHLQKNEIRSISHPEPLPPQMDSKCFKDLNKRLKLRNSYRKL